MAVYNAWVVEYKNGSTWTAIDNVQELSCQVGRQTAVDQWPVSQASIRVWYPEGYASPLANLTVGTYIRFFAPGRSSTKPSWTGLVKNVTLEVGIPWNSGLSDGNADFLTIDCEGALAVVGRAGVETIPVSEGTVPAKTLNTCAAACTYARVGYRSNSDPATQVNFQFWYDTSIPPPIQFWTDELAQIVAQCSALGNIRVLDGVKSTTTGTGWTTDDPAIYFSGPSSPVTTVGFSDTTNNSTNRIYDQIIFDGLADLYFDKAEVAFFDDEYGSQTTTNVAQWNLGIEPPRVFTTQGPPNNRPEYVINYTNQAQWLSNAFYPADIGVSSISATTANQHTQNLDTLGVTDLELAQLASYVVPITLRGTTTYAQIEGVAITADVNQTRFTYYVTPSATTAWFTLDSTALGVLDQNRLGIY